MLTVDLVAEVVGAAPAVGEAVLGVVADVGGGDQEAASGHSVSHSSWLGAWHSLQEF